MLCFAAGRTGSVEGILFHSSQHWVSGGQRGYTVSQLTELGHWRSERVYCFTAHRTGSVEVREGILFHSSWNGVSGGQRGYTVSQLAHRTGSVEVRGGVLFHSSWNGVSGGQRGYTVSQITELGQWRPDSNLFHGS